MGRRRRWGALALLVPLLVVALTGEPAARPPTADVRYTMWIAIGAEPSEQDLQASAGRDTVVIMNSDRLAQARTLRRLDPDVQILQYRDLASVRSYDASRAVVTGVSYDRAVREGWLARDSSGAVIEWGPYRQHFQVLVGDPDYQRAWIREVVPAAGQPPWSGVWADNDLVTLSHYSDARLAGSSDRQESDGRLRAGLDELLTSVGPLLNAEGSTLIVNISEGRGDHDRWARHAQWGGGTIEHFMAWSRNGEPDIVERGNGEWLAEASLVGIGPRTLAITTVAAGDRRTCAYGYASFLMFASPGDGWQCAWDGRYDRRWQTPETDVPLGSPAGQTQQQGDAWTREFQTGWAAVNPTEREVTVRAPRGGVTVEGRRQDRVVLAPHTGIVAGR